MIKDIKVLYQLEESPKELKALIRDGVKAYKKMLKSKAELEEVRAEYENFKKSHDSISQSIEAAYKEWNPESKGL